MPLTHTQSAGVLPIETKRSLDLHFFCRRCGRPSSTLVFCSLARFGEQFAGASPARPTRSLVCSRVLHRFEHASTRRPSAHSTPHFALRRSCDARAKVAMKFVMITLGGDEPDGRLELFQLDCTRALNIFGLTTNADCCKISRIYSNNKPKTLLLIIFGDDCRHEMRSQLTPLQQHLRLKNIFAQQKFNMTLQFER